MADEDTMILYHGAGAGHGALSPDKGRADHPDGLGVWLTESEATAGDFAVARGGPEATVHVVKATLRNPFQVTGFAVLEDLLRSHGMDASAARRALQERGFDGIVIDRTVPGVPDEERDFVVFSEDALEILDRRLVGRPLAVGVA